MKNENDLDEKDLNIVLKMIYRNFDIEYSENDKYNILKKIYKKRFTKLKSYTVLNISSY